MKDFAGLTALVTGGSSGIGRALAVALGARGARVVLAGRDRERLKAASAAIEAAGGAAEIRVVDLDREDQVRSLTAPIAAGEESLDVLVHAAGRHAAGSVEDTSAAALEAQLGLNLRAPFLLTAALLPVLRSRRGQIVFVLSSVVGRPAGGAAAYAASKHALAAFAAALREEVNPDGVRVLSVFPGRTATPMQEKIFTAEGRPYQPERLIQPDDVAAIVTAALALPRTAEVTDIHIRPMQKP